MAKTLNKHIRVDEDHWERIEQAAKRRGISPSRLMIEATLQAMEGPEWPRTEIEIRVARSCLFTAQAIARDMIAAGRGEEIEQIRRDVSHMAPELPGKQSDSPPVTSGPDPARRICRRPEAGGDLEAAATTGKPRGTCRRLDRRRGSRRPRRS